MEQLRLAPLALLAGLACGVGMAAVYQWTWGLVLATAVIALTLVAAPPGWGTRVPFAVGHTVAIASAAVPRPEGDYLIASNRHGYVVLAVAFVVLVLSLATAPRPGRPRGLPRDTHPDLTEGPSQE